MNLWLFLLFCRIQMGSCSAPVLSCSHSRREENSCCSKLDFQGINGKEYSCGTRSWKNLRKRLWENGIKGKQTLKVLQLFPHFLLLSSKFRQTHSLEAGAEQNSDISPHSEFKSSDFSENCLEISIHPRNSWQLNPWNLSSVFDPINPSNCRDLLIWISLFKGLEF